MRERVFSTWPYHKRRCLLYLERARSYSPISLSSKFPPPIAQFFYATIKFPIIVNYIVLVGDMELMNLDQLLFLKRTYRIYLSSCSIERVTSPHFGVSRLCIFVIWCELKSGVSSGLTTITDSTVLFCFFSSSSKLDIIIIDVGILVR